MSLRSVSWSAIHLWMCDTETVRSKPLATTTIVVQTCAICRRVLSLFCAFMQNARCGDHDTAMSKRAKCHCDCDDDDNANWMTEIETAFLQVNLFRCKLLAIDSFWIGQQVYRILFSHSPSPVSFLSGFLSFRIQFLFLFCSFRFLFGFVHKYMRRWTVPCLQVCADRV